jgi:hypothetical protein
MRAVADRKIDRWGSLVGANFVEVSRMLGNGQPEVTMEVVTNPVELAKSRAQHEHFDRNAAWLQAHAHEVYPRCRGKYMCIAGEELFIGNSPREAGDLGRAAHPDDDGLFVRYIPLEKLPRIYANPRIARNSVTPV